jgi:hypothetical protein
LGAQLLPSSLNLHQKPILICVQENSGEETRSRARRLSETLGAYHSDITIDEAITAHELIIQKTLNFKPRYKIEGGSDAENVSSVKMTGRFLNANPGISLLDRTVWIPRLLTSFAILLHFTPETRADFPIIQSKLATAWLSRTSWRNYRPLRANSLELEQHY